MWSGTATFHSPLVNHPFACETSTCAWIVHLQFNTWVIVPTVLLSLYLCLHLCLHVFVFAFLSVFVFVFVFAFIFTSNLQVYLDRTFDVATV